jgi:hypothetical protein
MDASTLTPTQRVAKVLLLSLIVLATFAGHCDKHKNKDRSVRLEERRQLSVTEDAAFNGQLPFEWLHGNPQPGTDPADMEEVEEFVETFKKSTAPKVLKAEVQPGATQIVELKLDGPSNLTGNAQWIGTASPLKVTITVNDAILVTGTATATGKNRGESNLRTQTPVGGRGALTITNTSNTKVKVRMLLVASAL